MVATQQQQVYRARSLCLCFGSKEEMAIIQLGPSTCLEVGGGHGTLTIDAPDFLNSARIMSRPVHWPCVVIPLMSCWSSGVRGIFTEAVYSVELKQLC